MVDRIRGGAISSAVLITLVLASVDWFLRPGDPGLGKLDLVALLAINLTLLANWCALSFGYQLIGERNSAEFRAIDTVVQALAKYLRFLLRPAATLEPLAREIDALEQYLTVQVAVSARRDGDAVVVEVANTGRWDPPLQRPSTSTVDEAERFLATRSVDVVFLDISMPGKLVQLPAIKSTQWQSRDRSLLLFADVRDPLPIGRTAAARLKELVQES